MSQGTTKGVPIDVDGTLSANSDQLVASQKAIKTYVDTGLATKQASGSYMVTTNNLSDVSNKLTSRINLGILDMKLTNGNQTTTSVTLANITDLVKAIDSNSRYSVEGIIWGSCNNTGGIFLAADIPASATMSLSLFGISTGATAFLSQRLSTDATAHGTAFNRFNSAQHGIRISGTITTAGTSGNLQMMFASGVAGETSTIAQEGTFIILTKIS